MIDEIIILENVVSKTYQNAIENKILKNENFPWYFVRNISKKTGNFESLNEDSIGFSHSFIRNNESNSIITDFLTPLLYESVEKSNLNLQEIFFGRIFFTFPLPPLKRNLFHVDCIADHIVVLYYVNDSDGETVILENTIKDFDQDSINNQEKLIIKSTIKPQKGKCVIFNGKFYHASTNPSTSYRAVINFDIGI